MTGPELVARLPAVPAGLAAPPGLWARLCELYAVPERHYHSIDHVVRVAEHFDDVRRGPGWSAEREVFCAVLFHDAVYVPGRADNERLSAEAARGELATTDLELDRVAELIELTARHGRLRRADVDRDAALFLDCDMAILGAGRAEFDRYERQVAREYGGDLDADGYRAGRRAFVERLLARDWIFLSDYFRGRYEQRARANLQRSAQS